MATTTHPTTAQPAHLAVSIQQGQIEMAWSAALAQLHTGKSTVDLPKQLTSLIGEQGLHEIRCRYSSFINARGTMFWDPDNNVWRFLPPPHFSGDTASSAQSAQSTVTQPPHSDGHSDNFSQSAQSAMAQPAHSDGHPDSFSQSAQPTMVQSAQSTMAQPPQVIHSAVAMPRLDLVQIAREPNRRSRPPRPMNAFMLYRRDNHPFVVANNPGAHNNRISQIIGAMWRNETLQVKQQYRDMAAAHAAHHRQAFPDYRYAPRRATDIKRRKTKAKAKGNVSGEFKVSDAPLNFVEPSVLEQKARIVDSLAGGSDRPTSVGMNAHDALLSMNTSPPNLGWIDMGMASRVDQEAYAAVLDNNELLPQAEANAAATASLAEEIATGQSALFNSSHLFNGAFELSATTVQDDFDPFAAASQRNSDLVAEGMLQSFNNGFNFPEREA
ncbi:MAT1-2-1 [Lasiodiplodia theobromae]|uniref:Mating-type protein Mat a-1 n=1 Tax=Lasiodiplodia theobromae TaxID=45133 RepID=UPI0015C323C9|nr:Mating-type protein Mat a-1 [Lasiodiplodia theobromae]KAF4541362.1 Mating-type protein Mat a-1 [Lasiodiplodia theobromae]KAF9632675.1 MAT1-2-1 [Lasiodiplodia theobromae]